VPFRIDHRLTWKLPFFPPIEGVGHLPNLSF
jgi:hypothetical protein